jgi:nucleotide exchange factor SIL1
MVHISARSLLGVFFLGLPLLSHATVSASGGSPSPVANTELICPTDHDGDCYPIVFSPTKDFQDIKEGQDIPPGLHVRMNIYTGKKEARLNIPMEGDETATELEGIPIEQAIVVVEQPEEESVPELLALRDQVPQKPPAYEAAGKIPPPPPSGGEISIFQKAVLTVQMEGKAFDSALDDLSELSHDIYYGVEIAKDGSLIEKLICLVLGSGSDKFPAKENKRDSKAAAILASSIQNNPTALSELADLGRLVMYPSCGTVVIDPSTKARANFVDMLRNRLEGETEPAVLKSKVSAMSGLLREPSIRKKFLDTKGMELLLAIWLKKGEQWDSVRMRVSQLVMDNFLDESMGANLGDWPKKPVAGSKLCETEGKMLQDGCWEHHIAAFSSASPKPWTIDFLKTLKEQRALHGGSTRDREL